jgi:hypothetical protein
LVKPRPVHYLFTELFKVLLLLIDKISIPIRKLREAQKIKNHSQRKDITFEGEIGERAIRVLPP